ncbi:helix-turn-helix transcriptional regulator [Oceanobacter mangrovi]|uniref:helix-turn-helix transcriptional regulator n=1 Tax=Oceanobacter mangrovi TaxID=2862510 RepID=UPI001C8DA32B|nr:helix-turn-helix transcriptional regulator [Oceanobacter mangrovi]
MNMASSLPLPQLISSLGSDQFESTLVSSLRALTGADHCLLISYQNDQQRPLTLFSSGAIYRPLARECRHMYDEALFLRDPNFSWLQQQAPAGEPSLKHQSAVELKDSEYRQQLLDRCGIEEKLAFMYQQDGQGLCLNLYRLDSSNAAELDQQPLLQHGELLASLLDKHIRCARQQRVVFDLPWVRARLQLAVASLLTSREIDVASRIVLGFNSDAIALDLGVSVNTILTHRRNLYDKLGIKTQNQLFGIVAEEGLPFRRH